MAKQPKKLIANNKKVYHDYFLEETFEAGIALAGTEVKSMRMGKCSIKESFIHIENGEVILYGMHISPYEKGNIFNKDPLRPRKLLMHKKEISKYEILVRSFPEKNGKQTCMKNSPEGEARSRSNIFLLRKEEKLSRKKREANVHEKFAWGRSTFA